MGTHVFFTAEKGFKKLGSSNGETKIHASPVFLPKEGFWYIYHCGVDRKKNDWRVDGYRWRQGGGKKVEMQSVTVQSRYFKAFDKSGKPTAEFRRCAFTRSDKPNHVLVQYIGDSSKAAKTVIRRSWRPSGVLNTPSSGHSPLYPQATSRHSLNLNVIEAAQKNARARIQLSDEAVRNLRHAMEELEFVRFISFRKENNLSESEEMSTFVALARLPALVHIFTDIASNRKLPPACLSLDASIDLESFYLSVLFFRESEFTEKPDLPLLFMIHDRKYCRRSFESFWRETLQLFPFLDKKGSEHYVVMDWEGIVYQTFRETLPNCPRFYRWPSVFKEANRKLKELKVTTSEDNFYIDSLWRLFSSKTVEEYEDRVEEIVKRWHGGFIAYYAKVIQPGLESIGRWAMLKRGVESTVLKRPPSWDQIVQKLQQWDGVPVDSLVMVLYRVSEYFTTEVKRGRYGIGNYRLITSEEKKYDNGEVFLFEAAPNLETVVENVRNASKSQFLRNLKSKDKELTVYEQAKLILELGLINLDTKTRTFSVRDVDDIYIVTLFPTVTCSCPGTGKCAHVIAAKLAIGVSCDPKKSAGRSDSSQENSRNEGSEKIVRTIRTNPANDDDSSSVDHHIRTSGTLLQEVRTTSSEQEQETPPTKKQCFLPRVIFENAIEEYENVREEANETLAWEVESDVPVWVRFKDWSLTMDAKDRIASGDILKGEEIQFAIQILRESCPNLHGFQNPCPLSHTQGDCIIHFTPIPDGERFVQILRTEPNNWACISNTLSRPTHIVVCDSLNINGKPTKEVVASIMALLQGWKFGKNSILQIEYLPIVKHQNEAESGPIAIACAEMLSRSVDPSSCIFHDSRAHLVMCFEKDVIELTEFPHFKVVGQDLVPSVSDSLHELPEIELK